MYPANTPDLSIRDGVQSWLVIMDETACPDIPYTVVSQRLTLQRLTHFTRFLENFKKLNNTLS